MFSYLGKNKCHKRLTESAQSKGRRSHCLAGTEKELGEAAHLVEGNSKVLWIILARYIIKLFRSFPSPSKKIYCYSGMRGEVEGESKVELRKLKTTHPHFLISSKGGIIAKCNDADVGMSLFLRGEKILLLPHLSSILIGL